MLYSSMHMMSMLTVVTVLTIVMLLMTRVTSHSHSMLSEYGVYEAGVATCHMFGGHAILSMYLPIVWQVLVMDMLLLWVVTCSMYGSIGVCVCVVVLWWFCVLSLQHGVLYLVSRF
uniref:NADH dehydrogenase subunit 4L n=1 Tax=Diplonema sp. ATCC 50224 TaxID=91375 RepID=A0A2D2AJX8_9EUGL|nr:hypothetical protein [Diplonema sp. ATCC 50224]